MSAVVLGLRVFLAAVLAVAGIGKVRNVAIFDAAAEAMPLSVLRLPAVLTPRLATGLLVATELVVAGLLLVWTTTPAGFVASTAVFLVMTVALTVILGRGQGASCRCFGADSGVLSSAHVVRAAVLFVAAAAGLVLMLVEPHQAKPLPAVALGAAIGGIMAATIVVNLDLLLYLRTPLPVAD